ncbi:serine protease inhibitor Kazal-type 13 precursor, partial [Daubentonia madagascariensis]
WLPFPTKPYFSWYALLWHILFSQPPCRMYYPLDPFYETNCPDITAYICATNGHTYQNECFFCVDQWEFGPHIKFKRHGKCS